MRRAVWAACAIASQLAGPAFAQTADGVETVVVAGNAPLGGAIDPAKVAGEIQTISVSDLTRNRQADVLPARWRASYRASA